MVGNRTKKRQKERDFCPKAENNLQAFNNLFASRGTIRNCCFFLNAILGDWRFRCALYLLSLSVEAMLNPGVWKSNPDDSITQPLLFDVFRPGVLLLKAGRRQIICTGHEKTQGKAQGGLVQ